MRSGETLAPYRLVVKAKQVGRQQLKVSVDSLRTSEAVQAAEDTTVLAE